MGDSVRQFEEEFARKFGMRHAVMVNSGSSANLVGVAALFHKKDRPLQRGDEVIVPAISWATTYHPLQQYGLKLEFVDVELETLNMDVAQLERALTPRTRMVMAVSILGNPAALDVMRRFCDRARPLSVRRQLRVDGRRALNGKPRHLRRRQHVQLLLLAPHLDDGRRHAPRPTTTELYHLARVIRAHGWTRDLPAGFAALRAARRRLLRGIPVHPAGLQRAAARDCAAPSAASS